jgi:glycerate kinase
MNAEPKYCENCKHYEDSGLDDPGYDHCLHPLILATRKREHLEHIATNNLVRKPAKVDLEAVAFCDLERRDYGECGVAARYYEAKVAKSPTTPSA